MGNRLPDKVSIIGLTRRINRPLDQLSFIYREDIPLLIHAPAHMPLSWSRQTQLYVTLEIVSNDFICKHVRNRLEACGSESKR
jgi:hypothetical protein